MPSGSNAEWLKGRFGALRSLRPFIAMVWNASPFFTLTALLLRLVRAVLPVAMLYVGKLIIDDVVILVELPNRPTSLHAWIESGLFDRLVMLVTAEFALGILSDVVGKIVTLVDSLLGDRLTNESSINLMEHADTLDLDHFEDAVFHDKLERARRQTGGRVALMTLLLTQIQDIVTVVTFGAGLLVYAPWLIVILLGALLPVFLGEAHFNAQTYALDFSRTALRRELDYVRQTAASVETAKEVKIFGLNRFLIESYKRLADAFYDDNRALAIRRAVWGSLFTVVGTAAYYFAYGYIVWRTLEGEFTIGDLSFLAASVRRLRTLLEGVLTGFSAVVGQALYLNDLFTFFDMKPRIVSPQTPRPFPRPIREGFVFEDVGFIYPGAARWTVRHLSFSLKAGEIVALVGESGAGKTTLVKLLTRLYDPSEGRILLDGHDLREYDVEELRSNMGVIFQDFVHYNFSAGDNIAVGRISARHDRERVEWAASRSHADTVIGRLPGGYGQRIGKRFKNGIELSGGEWQKIAIARAYMRDADVLILDEPTAALDARAEFEIFQRFKELSDGKTAVLISHRFSSVRMADRILVMVDGRVETFGTHEELIAKPGLYAELFELQAAGYR
jgi:ATP-binding cassette subfamily B protein